MGFPQNQSLSLGFTEPEVREWDSNPEPSLVNSIIILMGVLTFGLQLCLALFLLLRCWRYDKRTQEMIRRRDTEDNLWMVPSTSHLSYQLRDEEAAPHITLPSPARSATPSYCDVEERGPRINTLSGPFVAWDLVHC